MITTVVFDLDDTLYDEIEYCKSGFTAVAAHIVNYPGAPSSERIFRVLWRQFSTGNRTKTFDATLAELGLKSSDKLINELIAIYRNHKPKIILPHDSRNILDNFRGKYILALLTDGFLPAQRLKVQALEIEKYFKCIVYTDQLGPGCWKPSPAGFEKVLQSLSITPEKAVYVADNEEKDFVAPNKMGFLTIRLVRPAGIHKTISGNPDAAARYKINEISRLPGLLEGIY